MKRKDDKSHESHPRKHTFVVRQIVKHNFNTRSYTGKVRSRWSKTCMVMRILPPYVVEVTHDTKATFKVNGQCLKPYINRDLTHHKTPVMLQYQS